MRIFPTLPNDVYVSYVTAIHLERRLQSNNYAFSFSSPQSATNNHPYDIFNKCCSFLRDVDLKELGCLNVHYTFFIQFLSQYLKNNHPYEFLVSDTNSYVTHVQGIGWVTLLALILMEILFRSLIAK